MNKQRTGLYLILLAGIWAGIIFISGCATPQNSAMITNQVRQVNDIPRRPAVGLVLTAAGKGDNGINDAAVRSLKKVATIQGFKIKILEPREFPDDTEALNYLAENGFQVVIGTGLLMVDDLTKVARRYPETKFIILDAFSNGPNITALTVLNGQEAAFLLGAWAAIKTTVDRVGLVSTGPQAADAIRQGVDYVNAQQKKQVVLDNVYPTWVMPAWQQENVMRRLAGNLYDEGIDVVLHLAGPAGAGVVKEAGERRLPAAGIIKAGSWVTAAELGQTGYTWLENALPKLIISLTNGQPLSAKPATEIYTLDIPWTADARETIEQIKQQAWQASIPDNTSR